MIRKRDGLEALLVSATIGLVLIPSVPTGASSALLPSTSASDATSSPAAGPTSAPAGSLDKITVANPVDGCALVTVFDAGEHDSSSASGSVANLCRTTLTPIVAPT